LKRKILLERGKASASGSGWDEVPQEPSPLPRETQGGRRRFPPFPGSPVSADLLALPCDPAGRGWEASRWKLGDPHAYLEQVGALHHPRGHCYLALMILWGPLRLVSGPRC